MKVLVWKVPLEVACLSSGGDRFGLMLPHLLISLVLGGVSLSESLVLVTDL